MADDYRPFNSSEQFSMYGLFAALQELETAQSGLSRRLGNVDRGAQKLKAAYTYLGNVLSGLMGQMSERQRDIFQQEAKRKVFRVESRKIAYGAAERPKSQSIVWDDDLKVVCVAAWKEKCQMCGLKGVEAKKCPLKKSFDSLMTMETGTDRDCWYKPEIF